MPEILYLPYERQTIRKIFNKTKAKKEKETTRYLFDFENYK